MAHILAVDDDPDLCTLLKTALERDGHAVEIRTSGVTVTESLCRWADCILLDVMMPGEDGFATCRRIRAITQAPILFLTARVEEEDRVNGLLSGGDDYILKPFSLKELDARITAHLKREQRHSQKTEFRFHGELCIDYGQKNVQINEEIIEFTKLEYEIIELLSMHPGQVFDKERIYEITCGYEAEGDSRVITELIRRIRKKLGNYSDIEYIETVWGMGYKWKK